MSRVISVLMLSQHLTLAWCDCWYVMKQAPISLFGIKKKSRLKTIPPEQIPYVMQPWKKRFSCCLHRILVIQGFFCERPLYDVWWIWDVWINRLHQSRQCLLCSYLEFFFFFLQGMVTFVRRGWSGGADM